MSTKKVDQLTPAQCRAGRSLLDMTQSELANSSGLGLSTVVDFERERRAVSDEAREKLKNALIKAGVEFIDENGGGAGVRIRKRSASNRAS
jgi:DNA-binding transcriptional regulator YiaG